MAAQGAGAIVNVSSVAGMRILAGRSHVAYTASKAGVIGLSKSVAIAYAKQGIRCNTVVPGLMHTPLVEHRLVGQLGANDAAALIARRDAQVPMGRMGDAWDVAHAVRFLVSDEAKYVTATELVVDGGLTAATPQ
jgi:NAD(P)-dependent dehydrogenase (short-subunit alcohol dehydrogenase family)